jgi:DNA-binding response OmpR family regulator
MHKKPCGIRAGKIMDILLAEDDRNLGLVIKNELEEEDYNIDLVHNGVEAVLNFIEKPYDFILLDIKMPGLDGISTMRIIKKLNPRVPVITFSGNAGPSQIEESGRVGAIKCFMKPFAIRELLDCIKSNIALTPEMQLK